MALGPRTRRMQAMDAVIGASILATVCLVAYGILWVIDFGDVSQHPIALIRSPAARETLAGFSEVAVGVLGIAITVVAILVELAAHRYTPRITEMFVRDPVNVTVLSGFVVTTVLVVWTNMSLYGPQHAPGMAVACTVVLSVSLIAILPYFAYVFDFLSPTNVIARIEAIGASRLEGLQKSHGEAPRVRAQVLNAVEQLGDIALNSVDKKDKPLSFASLGALAALAQTSIRLKTSLPDTWFDSASLVHHDPDFIALHPAMVRALTARRTWMEMKILRQYQAVYGDALHKMRDVNHLIAIHTRHIAITGIQHDDAHVVQLSMRFFNTYMRAALNARDVRTAYNVLNEYRLFAEAALDQGKCALVMQLAAKITFYGQLAFGMQLAFILETAAYDLCTLLEQASDMGSSVHDQLLQIFLDVDREPDRDTKGQEASLRGVRKAQIKLATHYLVNGAQENARRIYEDMRGEPAERLRSIRSELEAVDDAEFWEVSDRGINFDWLPPDRRAQLDTFFAWFDQQAAHNG